MYFAPRSIFGPCRGVRRSVTIADMRRVALPFVLIACVWSVSARAEGDECYTQPHKFKTVGTSDWYEVTNDCGGSITIHYATKSKIIRGTQSQSVTVEGCGTRGTFAYSKDTIVGKPKIDMSPEAKSRTCVAKAARRTDDAVPNKSDKEETKTTTVPPGSGMPVSAEASPAAPAAKPQDCSFRDVQSCVSSCIHDGASDGLSCHDDCSDVKNENNGKFCFVPVNR
jgi:hypothetical protein